MLKMGSHWSKTKKYELREDNGYTLYKKRSTEITDLMVKYLQETNSKHYYNGFTKSSLH